MSEVLRAHLPCPDCGSSDALTEYTDGHTFCFSCESYNNKGCGSQEIPSQQRQKLTIIPDSQMEIRALKSRGIKQETCQKYGYFCTRTKYGKTIQVANYIEDGKVIFQKTRDKYKNFLVIGKREHRFFGQHLFVGGRKLVVTEGEIDCLTVSQVQGNKYPVVSIPFGCKSAVETFKENLEWLNAFDEVIVMFDMDDVGKAAAKKVGSLFPPHKLKIASLPLKDPNECLLAGKADAIVSAIWNSKAYHPDGVLNAKDLKEGLFAPEADIVSYSFPWAEKLTKMTRGIRKGEMLLLTAGSGIGKSTTAREIAYKLKMQDGMRVGMVMLEENPKKTLRDLLSIHMQRPLHLAWNEETKKAAYAEYDKVFGEGGFVIYDHFGSIEGNNLLQTIRYLIVCEGCDFVIFDHVTIAVSGLEETAGGDERKCIDRLMTNLRALIEETGAGIIIVSHLRKTDTKSTPFEQGGNISMDDLRGSGSLKQLPDTILALERNQQDESELTRNTLRIRVLKCRFTGDTGLSDKVRFNKATNRLEDVDDLEEEESEEDTQCQF